MAAYKNMTKIIGIIVAAAVLVCILALMFPEQAAEAFGGNGVALRYERSLFDTSRIMEIDIQMDEGQWEDMLSHASEEKYYSCDVVINQETIRHVGIRPKGNTSLTSIVADPDTDRFSFKMEFDHYVEGQTCLGLDKLILNNNYADATNMKEALVYDMYQYLGVDASLYNYARVRVNGEYWGVYLALEAVEDSFQLRNYGTAAGNLYKPESMGIGGRGEKPGAGEERPEAGEERPEAGEERPEAGEERPEAGKERPGAGEERPEAGEERPEAGEQETDGNGSREPAKREMTFDKGEKGDWESMAGPGHFMPGPGLSMNGGADLNYSDDDLDSYSTIWEGEVNNTGKKDHQRVVTALKNISEGKELERYLDVDNILRYMAVHVFSVNQDSLSGNMAHNYYLYEDNGKLNILPWDYNLSFGGMGMGRDGSASGVINDAIDTPFDITEFFDALLENEEYLARYHAYLKQLTDEYVDGGMFEEFYNRVRNQIDSLVETDPTAFYSLEEYREGAQMLYETVFLRGESIRGQLEGRIPSTDAGQKADSSNLVDASSIDLDVMGTMNMGGRGPFSSEDKGNPAKEAFGEASVFREGGNMPGAPGGRNPETVSGNLAIFGICLLTALLALGLAGRYKRIPRR